MTKVFPTLLIVLDFAAAGVYLWSGDWKRTVYWVCAGILTYTVTF